MRHRSPVGYGMMQRDAGYTLHGVTVEERDPKKRAAIYRQLVG